MQPDFYDLRKSHTPLDPKELELSFVYLVQEPRSLEGWPIFKFATGADKSMRLKRWLWWLALARIGIYVKELYTLTDHANLVNAIIADHPEVVGTVCWFTEDNRIDSPNANTTLWWRLKVGVRPRGPAVDIGAYRGRRKPK